jgi:hypothetical protein
MSANAQYALTVLIVGVIATAYMSFVRAFTERARGGASSMIRSIGSFVLHEHEWSFKVGLVLHFCAGVFFAWAYSYLFQILHLGQTSDNVPVVFGSRLVLDYVAAGAAAGFAQGFLLAFFLAAHLGNVPADEESGVQIDLPGAVLHVVSHVIFGVFVGLGFGMWVAHGTIRGYAGFNAAVLVVGLLAFLATRERKEPEPIEREWARERDHLDGVRSARPTAPIRTAATRP